MIRKPCVYCEQEFSAYKDSQNVCLSPNCRLQYGRDRYGNGEHYKRRYKFQRTLESKCLRCDKVFMTDTPIVNRICPCCTRLNRDYLETHDEKSIWF